MYKQLLISAEHLAKRTKRPFQADLRRAVSSAYYAMFHALCEMCANSLLGVKTPLRCERAWLQTYRALNHGDAKKACERCSKPKFTFPRQICDFADYFTTMQGHRNNADYDPTSRFTREQTLDLIDGAKVAINDLASAPGKHKKAFAAFLLFKTRD